MCYSYIYIYFFFKFAIAYPSVSSLVILRSLFSYFPSMWNVQDIKINQIDLEKKKLRKPVAECPQHPTITFKIR
jgi:hypothetical protein